jgi:hypothetical protein
MEWKITNWDGKGNFELTIVMRFIDHLDGMGEIYTQEMRLGLKAQGILK